MRLQRFDEGLTRDFLDTERLRNGGGDEGRVADGRQVDEEDAVGEGIEEFGGDLQAEAGLAHPPGSGECQ